MGMLFWRMHRAARIIFSLKFHLGEWTPQQCIDFLVDAVGHERASATGEVRRSFNGSYSPLYQAGYLLGGMQLRALHTELVSQRQDDRPVVPRRGAGGGADADRDGARAVAAEPPPDPHVSERLALRGVT